MDYQRVVKDNTPQESNSGKNEKFLKEQRVIINFIPKKSGWSGHRCGLREIR